MFLSHGAVARSYSCWICWGLPVCEVNQKWLFCGNEVTHTLLQPELIFKFKQAPHFHAESRQGTSSPCSRRAGQGPAVRGAGRRLLGRLAEPCCGELEPCRSRGAGCALQAPLGRGSARRELAALPSSPACSCRSLAAQEGQVLLGFQSRGTKQPPGWWQGSPGGSLAAHSHFASALQDLGAAPAGSRASSELYRGWRLSGAAPEAGGELLRHCQPGDLVCLSHFFHHGLCLLKQEAFRFAVPVLPVGERVAPAPLQLFTGPAVCFAAPARALGLTRFPCAHKVGQLLALGIISRETKRRAASLSPPPPAGANLRRGSASGSSVVLLGGLCGCRKGGTLTSHPKKEVSAGCLMQSQDRRGF